MHNLLYLQNKAELSELPPFFFAAAGGIEAKFWPWRESELVDLVHSRPNSRYYVDAFDFYHDGAYQYTRYLVLSL